MGKFAARSIAGVVTVLFATCCSGNAETQTLTTQTLDVSEHAATANLAPIAKQATTQAQPAQAPEPPGSDKVQRPVNPGPSTPQPNFNQLMTAAHVYVEAKQWEDARLLLAEALKIKPNSIAAQDLFMIVEQNLGRVHLRQQEAMFVDAMHAERWSDAVALAAGLDASSTFALKMDIQRSKSLAELEQAINGLLGAPSQLGRPSAQAEVNRITLLTESLDLGERLTTKYEQLIDAKRQWSAPVVVVLRSDNQTTVSLRPGRALGQFREKTVELMPGEYQLIGRRNGFREVRHALSLKPGQATQTYVIEASDRF